MSGQQKVPTNAFAEVVRLMRNDLRPLVEEDTKTKTQEPDVATTEAMLGVRQSALAEDRQDKDTVTSVEASDEMSSRARAKFNRILMSGAFTGHAINDCQNLCGAEESYPELLKQYVAKTGVTTCPARHRSTRPDRRRHSTIHKSAVQYGCIRARSVAPPS